MRSVAVFLLAFAVASALPQDWVIRKLDPGLRYQYTPGPDGTPRLVDLWMKASDVAASARYNPDLVNTYHLFTRENPTVSQPIVLNDASILASTNYKADRKTVILLHSWLDTIVSAFNTVLVPAFLEAADVNVIVVDWSHGSGTVIYPSAVLNTVTSGEGVARFITWLTRASGSVLGDFHIVGHGLGGHQAGIVGRNLEEKVPYITALDPSFAGWITNDNKFQADDGVYTEAIHTNAGVQGYLGPLADADFYPNGGVDMPGCISEECDHNRSFYYFAESVRSGGFTGTRCFSFITAIAGQCFLSGPLNMGGIEPKTGRSGIFYMRTNAFSPFSRG